MRPGSITYSRALASRFLSLLATCDTSVKTLCEAHPGEFPDPHTLIKWRTKYPEFNRRWEAADRERAWHFMEKCLDLANKATSKDAHAVRVKFDITKYWASKINPAVWGDKPSETSVSVQTAVVISPQQIDAIKANLDRARAQFKELNDKAERKEAFPDDLKQYDHIYGRNHSKPLSQPSANSYPLINPSHTHHDKTHQANKPDSP